MQQSQEGIKKEIIRHPFRNIEITYEPGKSALSAQDKELIAAYIKLNDFELEMKNTSENLYHESLSINRTIKELGENLKSVQAIFDACCTIADKLSDASYLVEEASLEKLAEAREQTQQALKDHHPKILAIYETVKAQQKKITEYNEADEDKSNILYDEFTELVNAHFENSENNTIDVVAFDVEFDQFRSYREATETRRKDLMTECDLVVTNYTNLNTENTALYNLWNEFIKRSDLLARMAELHTQATGFTEN